MRVYTLPDGPAVTDLTRRAGSANLAVCGLINVATAVALGTLAVRGEFVRLLVATLPTVVDEVVLVANAPLILSTAAWGAPVVAVAVAFLSIGMVQFRSSWHAYHARQWTRSVGSAVLGAVNPLVIPPGVAAAVLLWLSRAQFAGADGAPRT